MCACLIVSSFLTLMKNNQGPKNIKRKDQMVLSRSQKNTEKNIREDQFSIYVFLSFEFAARD